MVVILFGDDPDRLRAILEVEIKTVMLRCIYFHNSLALSHFLELEFEPNYCYGPI
jgi:hypothetical protein